MEFFQVKISVLLDKFVDCIKLFKIEGTGCNNINATFLSSKKDDLLNYVKFEFWEVSSFSCISEKDGKVFGKNTVTF